MFALALIALVVAGFALLDRYPAGKGPFDNLPGGLGERSKSSLNTAPTSKIKYETWTFPPGPDGRQFHVAARADGKLGWVSYWNDRATSKRTFYAGWTPPEGEQVAFLKKDFGL